MTREGTINEELLLQQQQQKDDESDVWTSFEQSVTYLKQVAAIYQQTFRSPQQQLLTAAAAPRKKVTKARLDEAKGQAQEALELLASNLLNASTAVVSTLETQEAAADTLTKQLDNIKRHLQKTKHDRAQQRVAEFFASALYSYPEEGSSQETRASTVAPRY